MGNVDVVATSTSAIESIVAAVSVSVSGGGSNATGASIGASRARNFIGSKRDGTSSRAQSQAYVTNSSIMPGGALSVTATGNQDIDALVLAASVAVAAGGNNAVGLSGSGVEAINTIDMDVRAYIDGVGTNGISADTLMVTADDSSSISSVSAAAALSVAAAGTGAGSLSIGVSLAENRVNNQVEAYIKDANQITTTVGDIDLTASSHGVRLFDLDTTGGQVVTATQLDDLAIADKDNDDTSQVDEAAEDVIGDTATRARLKLQFERRGAKLSDKVQVAILEEGESWVVSDEGNGTTYVVRKLPTNVFEVSKTTIQAISAAASIAAGFGGSGGIGLSGAGATSTNVIMTDTNAYIQDSVVTSAGGVDLDANTTSSVIATIIAASAGVGVGADAGVVLPLVRPCHATSLALTTAEARTPTRLRPRKPTSGIPASMPPERCRRPRSLIRRSVRRSWPVLWRLRVGPRALPLVVPEFQRPTR